MGPGAPIECRSWGVTGGLGCVCRAWVPDGCGAGTQVLLFSGGLAPAKVLRW